MPDITVFTTTYNRCALLRRLYGSLKRQTAKGFVWLVVDDGSTDDTQEWIQTLFATGKSEGKAMDDDIYIRYVRKENGGKHTAMKLGFALVDSPYMVEIDDDDELMPDAVETFVNEWRKIEEEGKNNIAEIRALSISDEGQISASFTPSNLPATYDSNYFVEDWCKKRHAENITCWKMSLVRPLDIFDIEKEWLYDRVKLVSESLFWNRIAKKYNTRYLNRPLRLYHADSGNSITLSVFNQQKCLNYVFSLHIIMNEMRRRGWCNPAHFLKYAAEYGYCGKKAGLGIRLLLCHLDGVIQKLMAVLAYSITR